jgi:hypothetical protein
MGNKTLILGRRLVSDAGNRDLVFMLEVDLGSDVVPDGGSGALVLMLGVDLGPVLGSETWS